MNDSHLITNERNDGRDLLVIDAGTFDIFAAYAETWRHNNLDGLQKILARPNGRIRVFLTDPTNEQAVAKLADRFSMPIEDIQRKILTTKREFAESAMSSSGTVEIYYYSHDRTFTFYIFDDTAIVTLYRHKRDRSPVIPTIVCESGGSFFNFIQDEMESIYKDSTLVWPPTIDDE